MLRFFLLMALCAAPVRSSAQQMPRPPVTIVPVGDSITQGTFFTDSYRRALQQKLAMGNFSTDFVGSQNTQLDGEQPPNPDFDLDHEGHWGWLANEVRDALPGWLAGYDADIAIVHIGTNDVYFGQDIAETVTEVSDIIGALRDDNSAVKILLAQIIAFADDPSGDVAAYNAQLETLAASLTTAQSPVLPVDLYTDFDPATMTYDGIHPNSTGEQFMADRMYPPLTSLIRLLRPKRCSVAAPGASVGNGLDLSALAPFLALMIAVVRRRPGQLCS